MCLYLLDYIVLQVLFETGARALSLSFSQFSGKELYVTVVWMEQTVQQLGPKKKCEKRQNTRE